jgi:heme A synthase
MRAIAYIFPITAALIFYQAVSGAVTVLNFMDVGTHMNSGYVVGIVALVSAIVAFTSKPAYNLLRYSSVVLLVLVVVQGLIGFAAQTSDQLVAVHFANALIVYGISVAMVLFGFRWGRMQAVSPIPVQK